MEENSSIVPPGPTISAFYETETPAVSGSVLSFQSVAGNSSITLPGPTTPAYYGVEVWTDSVLSVPLEN